MKRLFASVFCALLLQGSALATTLQTQIGDISIPTAKEINEQIDSLASDASLSDDDKAKIDVYDIMTKNKETISKID